MKLRNLPIFVMALTVSLAACGGGDEAAEGTAPADSAAVAPMPAPLPPAPMPADSAAMGGDTMSHDTMSGMSHDSMTDTTKM